MSISFSPLLFISLLWTGIFFFVIYFWFRVFGSAADGLVSGFLFSSLPIVVSFSFLHFFSLILVYLISYGVLFCFISYSFLSVSVFIGRCFSYSFLSFPSGLIIRCASITVVFVPVWFLPFCLLFLLYLWFPLFCSCFFENENGRSILSLSSIPPSCLAHNFDLHTKRSCRGQDDGWIVKINTREGRMACRKVRKAEKLKVSIKKSPRSMHVSPCENCA